MKDIYMEDFFKDKEINLDFLLIERIESVRIGEFLLDIINFFKEKDSNEFLRCLFFEGID